MKYKTTVYRTITQSIEIEVESDAPKKISWVKMSAEDLAAEESEQNWKDEGWEFDNANFNVVPVEEG